MHAIAWQIRQADPDRRVVYLSAEKFMYQFIQALRFQNTMSFKERFRSIDGDDAVLSNRVLVHDPVPPQHREDVLFFPTPRQGGVGPPQALP